MKTIYYNISVFLLLPLFCFANFTEGRDGKYTKEKSMSKEFEVQSDALLKISNDYGNLDITAWDQNRVVMEISIKVSGDNEEKVIKRLQDIDVAFETTPTLVSAKTIFNKENSSWWEKWSNGWNNNINMKINYTIKVPITNSVDLDNDYGSITLDKIKGHAKIYCDYGQIILGELLAENNYINIDYTNNSSIQYMKSGKINADYSNFEVENAEQIDLNADYTQSRINNIKNLNYNCDYGGIRIGKVGKMMGNGDYVSTKIGTVSKKIAIQSDYGSITIKELLPSTQSVEIKTDYTGVGIGYHQDCNFDFLIKTSYGGINLDESISLQKKYKNNSKKEYEGHYGNSSSGNRIQIFSSYGGIKLKKNQ